MATNGTVASNGAVHEQTISDLTSTLQRFGLSEVPQYPNAYPTINPVDIYRAHITELLAPITKVDPKIIYPAIAWTSTLDKGDAMLPVPALRIKGPKPTETAQHIVDNFPESPLVEKPTVQGTFVQFFFKPQPLANLVIPSILKNGHNYGFNPQLGLRDPSNPKGDRKTLVIDFSSPNIAKPFHAGHLRSTIIGGFLSNLYEKAGWNVVRLNYLGDWGKQYGILAIGFERFGNEEELKANPIAHLYDVYVKISAIVKPEQDKIKEYRTKIRTMQQAGEDTTALQSEFDAYIETTTDEEARRYFKRMEDADPEAVAVWKRFRDLSIEKMNKTYARLNIHYDDYSGESQVKQSSMDLGAKLLEEKNVSSRDEGAVMVDFVALGFKKLEKATVVKKDGTTLYLTRDIGAAQERHDKYNFDKMIYVVASQQDLHFKQLFKIEELIGREHIAKKCEHINFGMVSGMSTRRGTAKFLDDILKDVGDKMHEVMRSNAAKYEQVEDPDKTADILGISAVMVQDMSGKRINGYDFDMDRMCSFEGDTGPYLQYAHARLCSIMRRVNVPEHELVDTDLAPLYDSKHAVDLIRTLSQWPDVFVNTLKTQEPVTVLTYLFKMTHVLSSSYEHLQVVGSEETVLRARLALYAAARGVLGNGMRLLGLSPVERM